MTKLADRREENLFKRVAEIIEAARGHVARTVNSAMVHAYWLIGREIVEVEQHGKRRAGYGEQVLQGLSTRLTAQFGAGYSLRNLRRIRQFYLTYPGGSVVATELGGPEKRPTALAKFQPDNPQMFPTSLSWAHYAFLLRVEDPNARAFYEIEALREAWSARPLQPASELLRAHRPQARQVEPPGSRPDDDVCELVRSVSTCRARAADGGHRPLLREERRCDPA